MHIVDDHYSVTYELGSTNYATATNEEQINIITQYNSMINTLSNDQHFQLTLVVSKIYEQEYRLQNEFPLQKDKYDYLRKE